MTVMFSSFFITTTTVVDDAVVLLTNLSLWLLIGSQHGAGRFGWTVAMHGSLIRCAGAVL